MLSPGQLVEHRYEVIRLLGSGAMARAMARAMAKAMAKACTRGPSRSKPLAYSCAAPSGSEVTRPKPESETVSAPVKLGCGCVVM